MNIVVANTVGRLADGRHVMAYPAHWDWVSQLPPNAYKPNTFYPYELGYMSSVLKREFPDAHVRMVDGNLRQLDADEYAALLKPLRPDVLITETSFVTYGEMTKVMRVLAAYNADLVAYLGGPLATRDPDRARADGWIPIAGEYEAKVIAWLRREEEPAGYIDLDWLPWPEDDDVNRIDYADGGQPLNDMVTVQATRGCPLACNFCVVPIYYGTHGHSFKSHRTRDVEDVCDEIEYLAGKYAGRFTGAYFHDDAHNANPEWTAALAEAFIRRGLNRYAYDAMCGYWTFTEDLIALMARAGYKQVRMGIETLDEGVGKAIGKRVIPDKLRRALAWCKQYGLLTYGTTQVGAVTSTEAKDSATLAELFRLRADGLLDTVQHTVSIPLPGTPFFDEMKAKGWLVTEDFTQYSGNRAIIDRPEYPAERVAMMFGAYYAVRGGGHSVFKKAGVNA